MFNQMTGRLAQTKTTRCGSFSSNWTPGMNSNLVGYWKMNGTLGAVANGATATATVGTNGTVSGTTGSYVAGVISEAMSFSGVDADNNYIAIGSSAAVNNLTALTLMTWVKIPEATAMGIIHKSDDLSGSSGWFLYINSYSELYFGVVASAYNLQYQTSNTTHLINNTWAQIVVTWSGGLLASSVTIYVNGVKWEPDYTQNGSGTHASDAAELLYLGKKPVSGVKNFTGQMDEAAIWNRSLSAAEVAHLYKNQKCN